MMTAQCLKLKLLRTQHILQSTSKPSISKCRTNLNRVRKKYSFNPLYSSKTSQVTGTFCTRPSLLIRMAISQTAKVIWSKFMTDKNQFGRVLDKVKILTANDGRCTAELTVAEEHSNSHGTLHGGLSATIVDIISTLALVTHKRQAVGVSVDMHVTYLKGAEIGEDIIIEANTLRAGKTLAFLDVYIKKKKDGSLVAKGSHTKFVGNESGNLTS